ncbi:MAG TPA: arylesterase [Pyrinomonadaceae bacterium]|jgi:acyl-CoA thioesterase-1|nr:arylesterase [Pyrinomonadaceae bacterium]
MKLFLYALLLCVAPALVGCGGGNTNTSTSVQPTSDASPAPQVASSPAQSLPKIIAFGDSLTAGLGLSAAESYPALLQKKLDADGYKYEVVNAGASGDTSATGLRRIDWSLEQGDVRVVILELGANDFLRGQPVSETRKNLSGIIERTQARGAEVLLAGMYTPTSAGARYEREIGELFQTLAREHNVALIPFFLEGVAGQESLNQPDGIHPNQEGTRIVAETVYKYLRPILDKQKEQAGN